MVAEEVIVTLSGGAPWGFRLQGGVEHQRPLQVAKVRKRSKACRAGLREGDELVSINDSPCGNMSHAQAMNLIDSIPGALRIRVKRTPTGFQSVVLVQRAPSPRIDKEYRAALRAKSPSSSRPQHPSVRQVHHGSMMSPTGRSGLTSPPCSEAYYGETDSDADVVAHEKHRRQKRRSPSNSPGKGGRTSPEGGETSEMSGYDSAPDILGFTAMRPEARGDTLTGVARREVIYQPPQSGTWSSHTSTETSSMSADDPSPVVVEEDSGFQEPANLPPLVSPERAKEALMLSSRRQLVPMVGPVEIPVDEELTMTYMDKAKQAKLNRGESLQDKQVKEARTKCRTIASLLTDAPNPHSKGVLMFKKRRQRSKKYTLTSYGSVDEDMQPDSQEEDGFFPGSESEFDEEGFSAAPDPIWDSEVLDMLDKRSASRGLEGEEREDTLSPGLSETIGKGAQLFEQQRKRAEEHAKKMAAAQVQSETRTQQIAQALELSVMTETKQKSSVQPPPVAPKPARPPELKQQKETPAAEMLIPVPGPQVAPITNSDIRSVSVPVSNEVPITDQQVTLVSTVMPPPSTPLPELPASSVLNRTARPFAPGFISNRAATAPVVFRPTVAKKTPRPVSVAILNPPFTSTSEDVAASNMTVNQMNIAAPAGMTLAPMLSGPLPPPAVIPEPVHSLPPHISSSVDNDLTAPSAAQTALPADSSISTVGITATAPHAGLTDSTSITSVAPTVAPVPEISTNPTAPEAPTTPATQTSSASSDVPQSPVVYREKAQGAGSRTGILQEARRRSTHKPMFKMPENKKNSPNPALLSLVQNLDERPMDEYSEPVPVPENDPYAMDNRKGRVPPPVAPKPRVIPEVSQIPQAEGKGAELFARRQSRMDLYVVDSTPATPQQQPPPQPPQQQYVQPQQQYIQPQQQYIQPQQPQSVMAMIQPREPSPTPSQWKYSPNVRAPPPIGYNPLLSPSCPIGPQRGVVKHSEGGSKVGRSGYGIQKEGIKAIDFMRRQPYQLNPAMFSSGVSSSTQFLGPSYQYQRQMQEGHTLTPPRQVPVKTARVYEIKRFSTPTPMSGSTITPTVIVPRSRTTLAEPLSRSHMTSPPPMTPPSSQPLHGSTAMPARAPGLPELPKISATPIGHPVPYSPPAPMSSMLSLSYPGLQAAKQFKSAPELSALPPLRPPVQVPKPHFIATRAGIQPHVWRPGTMHH